MKPGSPAAKVGFRQIDVDGIGLLEDFPFDRRLMFRKDASEPWQAECHDRICRGETHGGPWKPGRQHSPEDAFIRRMEEVVWTRYSNMHFGRIDTLDWFGFE